jgi:acyl-CoA synthetase (AMP-forming)/AMP-acid ligase II
VTILDRTKLRTGSRMSVAAPMFHALGIGMLMLTLALGGTVLTHRRFDAEAALAQASLHRAQALRASCYPGSRSRRHITRGKG